MSIGIQNEFLRKLLRSYPKRAIEILYDAYQAKLGQIAQRITQNTEASQDLVQEAFVHVWENSKHLSKLHHQSIEHYLVRVVRNKAISYVRARDKQSSLRLEKTTNLLNQDPSVEQQIIHEELLQHARAFIETFPRRERQCLLLRIDAGLSTDEIARQLGVTRKAVERSLTSARKRLQARYKQR